MMLKRKEGLPIVTKMKRKKKINRNEERKIPIHLLLSQRVSHGIGRLSACRNTASINVDHGERFSL